jgi:hypothetical protein
MTIYQGTIDTKALEYTLLDEFTEGHHNHILRAIASDRHPSHHRILPVTIANLLVHLVARQSLRTQVMQANIFQGFAGLGRQSVKG